MDGRKCETVVTIEDDNKIVVEQKALERGKKDLKIIREFDDDGFSVVSTCEDVISRQYYQREP